MLNKNIYLSKENTQCMKGIFAVCVLIHHLYQYSGFFHGTYLGAIFQSLGYFSVAMFFFLTGYGLMLSSQKDGYMDSFLRKRVFALYSFYVVLIALYAIYNFFLNGTFSVSLLLQSFFIGGTVVTLGWYLQVTFFVYLLFWAVYKVFDKLLNQLVAFTACLVAYGFVCFFAGMSTTWYVSVLCVPLGMMWFLYKKKLDELLTKRKAVFVVVGGGLCVVAYAASKILPFSSILLAASCLFFVVVSISIAFALQNTAVVCNGFTKLLGRYSLEIYISQGFMLMLRRGVNFCIEDPYVFIIVAVVGTAIISIVVKPLYQAVTVPIKQS